MLKKKKMKKHQSLITGTLIFITFPTQTTITFSPSARFLSVCGLLSRWARFSTTRLGGVLAESFVDHSYCLHIAFFDSSVVLRECGKEHVCYLCPLCRPFSRLLAHIGDMKRVLLVNPKRGRHRQTLPPLRSTQSYTGHWCSPKTIQQLGELGGLGEWKPPSFYLCISLADFCLGIANGLILPFPPVSVSTFVKGRCGLARPQRGGAVDVHMWAGFGSPFSSLFLFIARLCIQLSV